MFPFDDVMMVISVCLSTVATHLLWLLACLLACDVSLRSRKLFHGPTRAKSGGCFVLPLITRFMGPTWLTPGGPHVKPHEPFYLGRSEAIIGTRNRLEVPGTSSRSHCRSLHVAPHQPSHGYHSNHWAIVTYNDWLLRTTDIGIVSLLMFPSTTMCVCC